MYTPKSSAMHRSFAGFSRLGAFFSRLTIILLSLSALILLFSLSGCQNDSGGAGRMRCNFLFPKLIQCMFHLVSPPCQNDLLKHSFSTFCQINLLKKLTAKQFFLKKFVLSLAQLQIRHRIQIPACARALLIFIVRRRADHRRIVRTEDR